MPVPDAKPTWNVGLGIQYPIFQGGQRKYEADQTQLNVLQLEDQKANLKNQLELRVRSNLEVAGASYYRVQRSQEAADAARRNFEIVQDSYSQGIVNITTLIDAQNASVQTELSAVNAVYQFLIDFLNVERSVGSYYSLSTQAEKDGFFQRLFDFLAND